MPAQCVNMAYTDGLRFTLCFFKTESLSKHKFLRNISCVNKNADQHSAMHNFILHEKQN